MGWARGEEIFHEVLDLFRPFFDDLLEEEEDELVAKLVEIFERRDADTIFDSVQPDQSDPLWRVFQGLYPEEARELLKR